MTVGELISILEQYDHGQEVLYVSQPSWPFENCIRGVTTRDEVVDEDFEDDEERGRSSYDSFQTKGNRSDVLLVEGGQVRYGLRDTFEMV